MDEVEQMREKIAHYKNMASLIADEKALKTIKELVDELEAKIALRGRSKKNSQR
jgi:hypothetical protein